MTEKRRKKWSTNVKLWTGVEECTVRNSLDVLSQRVGWLALLLSSLFLDCESSAPCRVVVAISKSFRGVWRAADVVEGPWRPVLCSRPEQQRADQSAACTEGSLTNDCCMAAVSSVHLKNRLLLLKQRPTLLFFSSHTLTVKMYFRETCKFFCTVLIICSILSCGNHCDMSSIK